MKSLARTLMTWLLAGVALAAHAYPDRPVKLVVAFPAGSQTDMVARLIAQQLTSQLGGTFLVENKPGASGTIAASQVARSAPDGYTLLVTGAGIQAMNYSMLTEVPYKPDDFVPLGRVASTGMVLMVKADSPIKSVADLVAMATAKPGTVAAAHGSPGAQIALALLAHRANVKFLDVPYKSIPNAVTDMLGGQVAFTFVDFGNAMAQIKGGSLRALAVTPGDGSTLMQTVPSLARSFPGYSVASWYGVMAPANTPKAVQEALGNALTKGMRGADIAARMAIMGVEPAPMDAAQFGGYIASEIKAYAEMIRIANIPKQ